MTTPVRARKKPIEIDAMQFDGTIGSIDALLDWGAACPGPNLILAWTTVGDFADESPADPATDVTVDTLEGEAFVAPGDYVIRGIKGEYYPCKPDIFDATYDILDGSDAAQ